MTSDLVSPVVVFPEGIVVIRVVGETGLRWAADIVVEGEGAETDCEEDKSGTGVSKYWKSNHAGGEVPGEDESLI